MLLPAIAILAIAIPIASADEFRMPFGGDHLVDFKVDVIFNPTEDGGVFVKVIQTSTFFYDNLIEMPEKFFITKDEQGGGQEITEIVIKEFYEDLITPYTEPEVEPRLGEITPEMRERIEAKQAELDNLYEEAILCKYGEGGSSVFQAKMEVIVLKEMEYFKHLPTSYQEKRLILATEACDVFKESYLHEYPIYEDFAEAQKTDIEPFVLDETDSPLTDPVTQRDLDEAEQVAKDLPKTYSDPYGGCISEFENDPRCAPRTSPTEGKACDVRPVEAGLEAEIMCPLQNLEQYIKDTPSPAQSWETIQQLVCDRYLGQYEHIVNRILTGEGDAVLPTWLAHCELNE